MSYKQGLVSVSFRKYTPDEILTAMNGCGLKYIEWGSDVHCPPEKASEIAALQKQYGIECCSYGTYFKFLVAEVGELEKHIAAAKILGTNVLRLWCGNKNSEDYTSKEKAQLFADCKAAAKLAEENGVTLCMECHEKTYTNKKDAAFELMQAVSSESFRMYWQPNQHKSEKENLEYAELLAPYTVNIHVFNWKNGKKYPLCEAVDVWREYLKRFDQDKALLLEFMPDGKLETLPLEAAALKEIAQ